jgi:tetratricopeptide (TPR) repeat protein
MITCKERVSGTVPAGPPLAVWACGQCSLAAQLAGCYMPATATRGQILTPAVASQLVDSFTQLNHKSYEAAALGDLGIALREVRRFDEAIGARQGAAVIFREVGDRHSEGRTLTNLGLVHREMRQPGRAAACWREAAAAMRDVGDHEKAARLERMAAKIKAAQRPWWRRTSRSAET